MKFCARNRFGDVGFGLLVEYGNELSDVVVRDLFMAKCLKQRVLIRCVFFFFFLFFVVTNVQIVGHLTAPVGKNERFTKSRLSDKHH